jgi:putative transposase
MTDKFRNKYRIKSARCPNWDYGSNASYFITICTKHREFFFGEIMDGKMQLSEIGKIAGKYWFEIPLHFPFIKLDEFVVMPNHIHGIIIVDKPYSHDKSTRLGNTNELDGTTVETLHATSQQPKQQRQQTKTPKSQPEKQIKNTELMSKISPKSGSLPVVLRSYKSVVSRDAHNYSKIFDWQPKFHDHIIRNEKSFFQIKNYILNNSKNWEDDRFFK